MKKQILLPVVFFLFGLTGKYFPTLKPKVVASTVKEFLADLAYKNLLKADFLTA